MWGVCMCIIEGNVLSGSLQKHHYDHNHQSGAKRRMKFFFFVILTFVFNEYMSVTPVAREWPFSNIIIIDYVIE
jgi:hypothetical protein